MECISVVCFVKNLLDALVSHRHSQMAVLCGVLLSLWQRQTIYKHEGSFTAIYTDGLNFHGGNW